MPTKTRAAVVWFAGLLALGPSGLAAPRAGAPEPAIYGHVVRIGWVVRDLDDTVAAWRNIGLTDVSPPAAETVHLVYRGHQVDARVRRATARFANARVDWVQPLGGGSPYAEFLHRHGDGVHHVTYRVADAAAMDAEVTRFRSRGVQVLASGTWQNRPGQFVDLATAAKGGVVVELASGTPGDDEAQGPPNADPFGKVVQYAFVVRDLHAVSDYYDSIGLGPLAIERNVSLNREYRGHPAGFEMLLGWGRTADVVFEWIQSTIGPNVYEEYLAQHGEGLHHLGFNVMDMDATIARLTSRGLSVTMSGGWNVNGYEGRFAYLDTERHGGVTIELLWNKPR
jgi:methylmalonyl-CoA/ethylmalonyl-CoA epimerase